MLLFCVFVFICVRLFKENSIKKELVFVNLKKKKIYENEINCIFGEKKKKVMK